MKRRAALFEKVLTSRTTGWLISTMKSATSWPAVSSRGMSPCSPPKM
jgi:hypothetical protein